MSTFFSYQQPNHISALLPLEARQLLARAAQEAKNIADDLKREVHMESAIRRVKLSYPEFFKE